MTRVMCELDDSLENDCFVQVKSAVPYGVTGVPLHALYTRRFWIIFHWVNVLRMCEIFNNYSPKWR